MVYAAGICGSLEQMQDLNIIRPALFAGPAPLLEPGVGAEGGFRAFKYCRSMQDNLLLGFAANDQSLVCAAVRAGAKWGSTGGTPGVGLKGSEIISML